MMVMNLFIQEVSVQLYNNFFTGIDHGIPDVFFPELNLMKRIARYDQATENSKEFLMSVLCKLQNRRGVSSGYDWIKVRAYFAF